MKIQTAKRLINECGLNIYPPSLHTEVLDVLNDALDEYEKQGWIPCSERLPEYTGEYNATIGFSDAIGYIETSATLRYEIRNGKHLGWIVPNDFEKIIRVIAWMPLPKPYKESED